MLCASARLHPLDFHAFSWRQIADLRPLAPALLRMNSAPAESTPPADVHAQNEADAALLREIASGDRDALARLYDRFSRPLFGVASRILRDATEAEDVVHDVFITIWQKAAAFEPARCSALGWAIALTRNRAIDRFRTRRRRHEILETSAPADLGYDETAPSAASSSTDLWQKEKATAVRRAVTELSSEQRNALELAFFSGLTQQEIATRLHEPLGTVKARIRRGLLKLRDLLADRL
jgi:RNA polymerase sigma-70 factor (ECF subfamily)